MLGKRCQVPWCHGARLRNWHVAPSHLAPCHLAPGTLAPSTGHLAPCHLGTRHRGTGADKIHATQDMSWWHWLAIGLVLVLLELAASGGFYVIFFGVAAIAISALNLFGLAGPLWVQLLLFSAFSVAALLLFRRPGTQTDPATRPRRFRFAGRRGCPAARRHRAWNSRAGGTARYGVVGAERH